MQYLYGTPGYVVMDTETYEQLTIPAEIVGGAKDSCRR